MNLYQSFGKAVPNTSILIVVYLLELDLVRCFVSTIKDKILMFFTDFEPKNAVLNFEKVHFSLSF